MKAGFKVLSAAMALAAAMSCGLPAYGDPPGTVTVSNPGPDAWSYSHGLGPGVVYTTGYSDADFTHVLYRQRVTRTTLNTIKVWGRTVADGNVTGLRNVSVGSNRVLYGSVRLRWTGAGASNIGTESDQALRLSGNRALYLHDIWPELYNIATGDRWAPFGTSGDKRYPTDLWGQYFAYALPSGAVYRRDLRTGTTVQLKPAGTAVAAVAVYAHRVAWVTKCPSVDGCDQTLAWRAAGGPVYSAVTRGTTILRMSGGKIAYNFSSSGRSIRTIDLGTGNGNIINSGAAVFDLSDDLISWIGTGGLTRIAPLSSHVESPRYLGTPIAPASFTPNGDGSNDLWRAALPVSKQLTDCRVTIRKNGTAVRIIGCAANSYSGMASVAWDGRTGSGKPVSKGTYTWTLTGSDSDGSLLWYSGSSSPINGTFKVA